MTQGRGNQMHNAKIRAVARYVFPTMLSNFCFVLFTIIDAIFVGRGVGTNALGAINLVNPFVLIVSAMNLFISVGGVAICAVHMGKGDYDGANTVFRHGMFLLSFAAAVLSLAGMLFTDNICSLLGAGETFHSYAADYLFWYSLFIIPSALSAGLQNYCRNDNALGLVGMAVIISSICNILGDWLLVFPLAMGTKGAAIATGVSQTLGLLIMLTHFARKNGKLRLGKISLNTGLLREIIFHGLPEGVSQLATPIMKFCMNLVLIERIGDLGVNAFSVVSNIAILTMGIFSGASEGLQPLFGQSYGAKNEKDLKFYFKSGLIISFTGSAVITILTVLLRENICALFGADAATTEYVLQIYPLFSIGFIVMAINVMITAYLYSTERSALSTSISLLRSVILNSAIILFLPKIFGNVAIWLSMFTYEATVLMIAMILLKHSERNGIQFK
ncbi:MATE family efflux transporter [Clostridiaceae bacterium]|nr:MATE family efflux transporter [Clostridiaceae bacterium]